MPLPVGRLVEFKASPKALGPGAGEEQCLGDTPWVSRATAIKPDGGYMF
jgi:hypothetical protein